jgi:hypothetical protein
VRSRHLGDVKSAFEPCREGLLKLWPRAEDLPHTVQIDSDQRHVGLGHMIGKPRLGREHRFYAEVPPRGERLRDLAVEVTGRSGDGGIDGEGIVRVGGLLSFHVLFQCKRYQGSVSPSAIRDFHGALVGRADKGLFVTTGTFAREATREATRDGATPVDLLDGDQLAEKLKELRLGVRTGMVENVGVDAEWFRNL